MVISNRNHRQSFHGIRVPDPFSICLALGVLLLSACGGGGGGDPPVVTGVSISGTIDVPGGVQGGPPAGANKAVSLVRIDDDGKIIGDVLDSTTSDLQGHYVLILPANVPFSSDIIVEVKLDNNQVARAIVIDKTTDITPITEYITSKLIDDPTLNLASLPLAEVTLLVEFVESLNLPPAQNLVDTLAQIAIASDVVVDAEIGDIVTPIQQIRLSGLLSVPAPAAPRNVSGAQRPVANTVINLYQIDGAGNIIGGVIGGIIETTTTNDDGVFTLLLPMDQSLSAGFILQAIVGTDIVNALVTNKQLNLNAVSQYVFDQVTQDPDLVESALPVSDVYAIIQFVESLNIPETEDLTSTLSAIDTAAAQEVSIQIDNLISIIAAEPGFFGSSNWGTSAYQ